MSTGFFTIEESSVVRGDEVKITAPKQIEYSCNTCTLKHDCKHPNLPVMGAGRTGVMIVGDYATQNDDLMGACFSGNTGELLRELLKDLGLNIHKDFYRTLAVNCSLNGKDQSLKFIYSCREVLKKNVEKYKPKVILALGSQAMESIIGQRMSSRVGNMNHEQWIGFEIPDFDWGCWVVPTWPPRWILSEKKEQNQELLKKALKKSIKKAIKLADKPAPKSLEYKEMVEVVKEPEALNRVLRQALEHDEIVIDYETTGLKPHRAGHKIACASICFNKDKSYSFELNDSEEFRELFCSILKKGIIAHNSKFELAWSFKTFGVWPKIKADPMLAEHILKNKGRVGLKLLAYTYCGVAGYDNLVDYYLKSLPNENQSFGGNGFNSVEQAPKQELLKYCAIDSLLTYRIYQAQKKQIDGMESYAFFIEATEMLARAEWAGIRLDEDGLESAFNNLNKIIDDTYEAIQNDPAVKRYWKSNKPFRPSAADDIKLLLFDGMGYDSKNKTDKGGLSTDKNSLEQIDLPIIKKVLMWKKWQKARDTYLKGLKREAVEGFIHPFFNLHNVTTYRSCIAKGSKVLVPFGYKSHPNGVPIEDIKKGDFVYCFNNKLKPVIKKVLWAGKTGHREVIRVHYIKGRGKKGYIDCTPEHRIRLVSGEYVEAQDLLKDYRDKKNNKWKYQPKCRVLSMERVGDRLFSTNNNEILEHRFIYSYFKNITLKNEDVIHHIDGNHLNHNISNLELTTLSKHSLLHTKDTLNTVLARKRNVEVVKKKHRDGEYAHIYKKGNDHINAIVLSCEDCLRILKETGGKITKTNIDFQAFHRNCEYHNIDIERFKTFYNSNGLYLTKDIVKKQLEDNGLTAAVKNLKVNYYRLLKIMDFYKIGYERSFCNQNGFNKKHIVTENNHTITKIEKLNTKEDVYDLEVEDEHNFIVEGICVHNSSDSPNFQNFPKRDKEVYQAIRSVLKPMKGHKIAEYDYKALEVSISACYNKDPQLIKYLLDPTTDMHRDVARDIFKRDDITKEERFCAKNGFVFASFYGSYYGQTAPALWDMMPEESKQHLYSKGIKDYADFEIHIKEVESIFWDKKFKVYRDWKKKTYAEYLSKGYIDTYTGFRLHMPMGRNEVLNYAVQGSAFHCLLWTLTQVSKVLEKKQMKSKIIGQIHDAGVFSIAPGEETEIDRLMWLYGTQRIKTHWNWIITPLVINKEIADTDQSWSEVTEVGEIHF